MSLLYAILFSATILISAIPWMGHGEFKYSGDGFCYFDWYDDLHMLLTLIISVVTLISVSVLFILAANKSAENKAVLLCFPLAFISGWILWPVDSGIGLSGDDMPSHLLITGAVLGHMQALVNPFLYGIVWRDLFIPQHEASVAITTVHAVTEAQDGQKGGSDATKELGRQDDVKVQVQGVVHVDEVQPAAANDRS